MARKQLKEGVLLVNTLGMTIPISFKSVDRKLVYINLLLLRSMFFGQVLALVSLLCYYEVYSL